MDREKNNLLVTEWALVDETVNVGTGNTSFKVINDALFVEGVVLVAWQLGNWVVVQELCQADLAMSQV